MLYYVYAQLCLNSYLVTCNLSSIINQAVVVQKTRGATSPQSLSYETNYPKPTLVEGYAIVKNEYSGINFIDTYHRSGLYPRKVPFICGQEGGGTIESISYDNNGNEKGQELKVGDNVVYSHLETYAEFSLVPIDKLIAVPAELNLQKAIACMVQGLTAHYLVSSAHAQLIKKNE